MASKRELIEPHTGDKRYVQRDGRSLPETRKPGAVAGGGSTSPCKEGREAGARR